MKIKKFNQLNEDVQDEIHELDGFYDEKADKIKRVDKSWSDDSGSFYGVDRIKLFERLKCNNCGSTTFEVLLQIPADYQLVAQCSNCKKYFIPYTG